MKMHPYVKLIRDAAAGIKGVWVRRYGDGVMYAGIAWDSVGNPVAAHERLDRLRVLCVDLGFDCGANGKPGTSGEYSFMLAETARVDTTSRTNAEIKRTPKPTGFRIRYRFSARRPWRFMLDPHSARKHARYPTQEAAEAASNRRPKLPNEEREIVE